MLSIHNGQFITCLYINIWSLFNILGAHWYIYHTIPPSQLFLAYNSNLYTMPGCQWYLWFVHLSFHIFLTICSFWTLMSFKLFIHCSIALNFTYGVGTTIVPVPGTFPSGSHCLLVHNSTSHVLFQIGSLILLTLHNHPWNYTVVVLIHFYPEFDLVVWVFPVF